MTAPATPINGRQLVIDFFTLLPDAVRAQVNSTHTLKVSLIRATGRGWTMQQLVDEACRDLDRAQRVAALVTHRLAQAATMPPPRPVTTLATFVQPNPPCGNCDPITRWTNDLPARRCSCWTPPPKGP